MPHIGPTELIILLVIVLIIFGVGRLPEIGGALGRGIREFRKGTSDEDDAPKAAKSKAAKPKAKAGRGSKAG